MLHCAVAGSQPGSHSSTSSGASDEHTHPRPASSCTQCPRLAVQHTGKGILWPSVTLTVPQVSRPLAKSRAQMSPINTCHHRALDNTPLHCRRRRRHPRLNPLPAQHPVGIQAVLDEIARLRPKLGVAEQSTDVQESKEEKMIEPQRPTDTAAEDGRLRCADQSGAVLDNSQCLPATRPLPCNTQACSGSWVQTSTGTCSAPCGGGVQSFEYACENAHGVVVPVTAQVLSLHRADAHETMSFE